MEILINGRFLTQPVTGVQRYAREILKKIDENIAINHNVCFTICVPKSYKGVNPFKNIKMKRMGFYNGHIWEQIFLAYFSKRKRLINLTNTGPLFKKNQLVTIHDAAVFANEKNFSFVFRNWYKTLLKCLSKNSKYIITVSEFSKEELIKYLKLKDERIAVVPGSYEQILDILPDEAFSRRLKLNKTKYILAVSSMNPNKNFKSVLKAIDVLNKKNLEIKFFIAGQTNNSKVFGEVNLDKNENVTQLGYVNDSQLKSLYENAYAFVFPSFYEGFGLPVLEAMASSCPVITSNRASLPEVCKEAAIFCDPENYKDLANKIELLYQDEQMRLNLISKGKERLKFFSWEKSAEMLMDIVFNDIVVKRNDN